MSFEYQRLRDWAFPEIEQTYSEKDTILYALGLGLGADPMDDDQRRFVYEKQLQALPTMAVVLGYPGFWMQNPETGVDWVKVVHGEQSVVMHKPLPAAATVIGRSRVVSVTDKGEGKGAIVVFETEVSDKASGELLGVSTQVVFCRGNGGYSRDGQPSDARETVQRASPQVAPDAVCDLPTRPDLASIYRLSADYNPLHIDPDVAKAAGFERPILHGLATFGIASHALIKTCCGYDASRVKSVHARFSAPMYPGETLRTEIWHQGSEVHFKSSVVERGVVVLSNGFAEVA